MLFFNFLCLFYLMVLINCHTISKSISNDEKTLNDIIDSVHGFEYTTETNVRHERHHHKYRRENREAKEYIRTDTTPITITGKSSYRTTTVSTRAIAPATPYANKTQPTTEKHSAKTTTEGPGSLWNDFIKNIDTVPFDRLAKKRQTTVTKPKTSTTNKPKRKRQIYRRKHRHGVFHRSDDDEDSKYIRFTRLIHLKPYKNFKTTADYVATTKKYNSNTEKSKKDIHDQRNYAQNEETEEETPQSYAWVTKKAIVYSYVPIQGEKVTRRPMKLTSEYYNEPTLQKQRFMKKAEKVNESAEHRTTATESQRPDRKTNTASWNIGKGYTAKNIFQKLQNKLTSSTETLTLASELLNDLSFGTAEIECLISNLKDQELQTLKGQSAPVIDLINNSVTETSFDVFQSSATDVRHASNHNYDRTGYKEFYDDNLVKVYVPQLNVLEDNDRIQIVNLQSGTYSNDSTAVTMPDDRYVLARSARHAGVSTMANDFEQKLKKSLKGIYLKAKKQIHGEYETVRHSTKKVFDDAASEITKIVNEFNPEDGASRTEPTVHKSKFLTNTKHTTFANPKPHHTRPTLPIFTHSSKPIVDVLDNNDDLQKTLVIATRKPWLSFSSVTEDVRLPNLEDDYAMLKLFEQVLSKRHEENAMKSLTTPHVILKRGSRGKARRMNYNTGTVEDMTVQYNDKTLSDDKGMLELQENEAMPYNLESLDRNGNAAKDFNFDLDTVRQFKYPSTDNMDASYEGLTNKLSYNEYVNGYKHYLNFAKQLGEGDQNKFSNLVRYQAHRHHNVDDIGKFILSKLPPTPTPTRNFYRSKRYFFDDSDTEDQDISTKNDDSWFKKHFYMFLDTTPSKKHTSAKVYREAKYTRPNKFIRKTNDFEVTLPCHILDQQNNSLSDLRNDLNEIENVVNDEVTVFPYISDEIRKNYLLPDSTQTPTTTDKLDTTTTTEGMYFTDTNDRFKRKSDSKRNCKIRRHKKSDLLYHATAYADPTTAENVNYKDMGFVDISLVKKSTKTPEKVEKREGKLKRMLRKLKPKKKKKKKEMHAHSKIKRQLPTIRSQRYNPFKKLKEMFTTTTTKGKYEDHHLTSEDSEVLTTDPTTSSFAARRTEEQSPELDKEMPRNEETTVEANMTSTPRKLHSFIAPQSVAAHALEDLANEMQSFLNYSHHLSDSPIAALSPPETPQTLPPPNLPPPPRPPPPTSWSNMPNWSNAPNWTPPQKISESLQSLSTMPDLVLPPNVRIRWKNHFDDMTANPFTINLQKMNEGGFRMSHAPIVGTCFEKEERIVATRLPSAGSTNDFQPETNENWSNVDNNKQNDEPEVKINNKPRFENEDLARKSDLEAVDAIKNAEQTYQNSERNENMLTQEEERNLIDLKMRPTSGCLARQYIPYNAANLTSRGCEPQRAAATPTRPYMTRSYFPQMNQFMYEPREKKESQPFLLVAREDKLMQVNRYAPAEDSHTTTNSPYMQFRQHLSSKRRSPLIKFTSPKLMQSTTKKPYKHVDYFDDLVNWHRDILNLESMTHSNWDTFLKLNSPQQTTPSIRALQEEIVQMKKFLNSLEHTSKPTARVRTKTRAPLVPNVMQDKMKSLTTRNLLSKIVPKRKKTNRKEKSAIVLTTVVLKNSKHPKQQTDLNVPLKDLNPFTENYQVGKEALTTEQPNMKELSVDTTLLAYDDSIGLMSEEMSDSRLKNNAKNTNTRFAPGNVKATVSAPPQQYFTTPIPMHTNEFTKFLKDNNMDIATLTSPISNTSDLDKTNEEQEITKPDRQHSPKRSDVFEDYSVSSTTTEDSVDNDWEYLDELQSNLVNDKYYMDPEKSDKDELFPVTNSQKQKRRVTFFQRARDSPDHKHPTRRNTSQAVDITIIDFDDKSKDEPIKKGKFDVKEVKIGEREHELKHDKEKADDDDDDDEKLTGKHPHTYKAKNPDEKKEETERMQRRRESTRYDSDDADDATTDSTKETLKADSAKETSSPESLRLDNSNDQPASSFPSTLPCLQMFQLPVLERRLPQAAPRHIQITGQTYKYDIVYDDAPSTTPREKYVITKGPLLVSSSKLVAVKPTILHRTQTPLHHLKLQEKNLNNPPTPSPKELCKTGSVLHLLNIIKIVEAVNNFTRPSAVFHIDLPTYYYPDDSITEPMPRMNTIDSWKDAVLRYVSGISLIEALSRLVDGVGPDANASKVFSDSTPRTGVKSQIDNVRKTRKAMWHKWRATSKPDTTLTTVAIDELMLPKSPEEAAMILKMNNSTRRRFKFIPIMSKLRHMVSKTSFATTAAMSQTSTPYVASPPLMSAASKTANCTSTTPKNEMSTVNATGSALTKLTTADPKEASKKKQKRDVKPTECHGEENLLRIMRNQSLNNHPEMDTDITMNAMASPTDTPEKKIEKTEEADIEDMMDEAMSFNKHGRGSTGVRIAKKLNEEANISDNINKLTKLTEKSLDKPLATIETTTMDKREAQETDMIYTAKNVAAFEIIVDLMKEPDSITPSVATAPPTSPISMPSPAPPPAPSPAPTPAPSPAPMPTSTPTPIPSLPTKEITRLISTTTRAKENVSTNSIQVHIAIPYSIGDRKRSVDPVKVRKVFAARMSAPVDLEYIIRSYEISDNLTHPVAMPLTPLTPLTSTTPIPKSAKGMYLYNVNSKYNNEPKAKTSASVTSYSLSSPNDYKSHSSLSSHGSNLQRQSSFTSPSSTRFYDNANDHNRLSSLSSRKGPDSLTNLRRLSTVSGINRLISLNSHKHFNSVSLKRPSSPRSFTSFSTLKPMKNSIRQAETFQQSTRNLGHNNAQSTNMATPSTSQKEIARVTLTKDFIQSFNEQLLKLYQNLSAINEFQQHKMVKRSKKKTKSKEKKDQDKDKEIEKEKQKQVKPKKKKKKINWDFIRKYFKHERVCDCKCKENGTMCKACAASDAVMTELLFEFDNLAAYMTDHCTEIQTYFWMNPSGGRKLREVVHRIDKNLSDYFKRVKGKCKGRTCSAFQSYLDKRAFATPNRLGGSYIEEFLLKDVEQLGDDIKIATKLNLLTRNEDFKERSEKLKQVVGHCLEKQKDRRDVKSVYSLDNINVNIICNDKSSSTTAPSPLTSLPIFDHSAMTFAPMLPDSLIVTDPPPMAVSPDIDRNSFQFFTEDTKKKKGLKKLFFKKKKTSKTIIKRQVDDDIVQQPPTVNAAFTFKYNFTPEIPEYDETHTAEEGKMVSNFSSLLVSNSPRDNANLALTVEPTTHSHNIAPVSRTHYEYSNTPYPYLRTAHLCPYHRHYKRPLKQKFSQPSGIITTPVYNNMGKYTLPPTSHVTSTTPAVPIRKLALSMLPGNDKVKDGPTLSLNYMNNLKMNQATELCDARGVITKTIEKMKKRIHDKSKKCKEDDKLKQEMNKLTKDQLIELLTRFAEVQNKLVCNQKKLIDNQELEIFDKAQGRIIEEKNRLTQKKLVENQKQIVKNQNEIVENQNKFFAKQAPKPPCKCNNAIHKAIYLENRQIFFVSPKPLPNNLTESSKMLNDFRTTRRTTGAQIVSKKKTLVKKQWSGFHPTTFMCYFSNKDADPATFSKFGKSKTMKTGSKIFDEESPSNQGPCKKVAKPKTQKKPCPCHNRPYERWPEPELKKIPTCNKNRFCEDDEVVKARKTALKTQEQALNEQKEALLEQKEAIKEQKEIIFEQKKALMAEREQLNAQRKAIQEEEKRLMEKYIEKEDTTTAQPCKYNLPGDTSMQTPAEDSLDKLKDYINHPNKDLNEKKVKEYSFDTSKQHPFDVPKVQKSKIVKGNGNGKNNAKKYWDPDDYYDPLPKTHKKHSNSYSTDSTPMYQGSSDGATTANSLSVSELRSQIATLPTTTTKSLYNRIKSIFSVDYADEALESSDNKHYKKFTSIINTYPTTTETLNFMLNYPANADEYESFQTDVETVKKYSNFKSADDVKTLLRSIEHFQKSRPSANQSKVHKRNNENVSDAYDELDKLQKSVQISHTQDNLTYPTDSAVESAEGDYCIFNDCFSSNSSSNENSQASPNSLDERINQATESADGDYYLFKSGPDKKASTKDRPLSIQWVFKSQIVKPTAGKRKKKRTFNLLSRVSRKRGASSKKVGRESRWKPFRSLGGVTSSSTIQGLTLADYLQAGSGLGLEASTTVKPVVKQLSQNDKVHSARSAANLSSGLAGHPKEIRTSLRINKMPAAEQSFYQMNLAQAVANSLIEPPLLETTKGLPSSNESPFTFAYQTIIFPVTLKGRANSTSYKNSANENSLTTNAIASPALNTKTDSSSTKLLDFKETTIKPVTCASFPPSHRCHPCHPCPCHPNNKTRGLPGKHWPPKQCENPKGTHRESGSTAIPKSLSKKPKGGVEKPKSLSDKPKTLAEKAVELHQKTFEQLSQKPSEPQRKMIKSPENPKEPGKKAKNSAKNTKPPIVKPKPLCGKPNPCEKLQGPCEEPKEPCGKPNYPCDENKGTCEEPTAPCDKPQEPCGEPKDFAGKPENPCGGSNEPLDKPSFEPQLPCDDSNMTCEKTVGPCDDTCGKSSLPEPEMPSTCPHLTDVSKQPNIKPINASEMTMQTGDDKDKPMSSSASLPSPSHPSEMPSSPTAFDPWQKPKPHKALKAPSRTTPTTAEHRKHLDNFAKGIVTEACEMPMSLSVCDIRATVEHIKVTQKSWPKIDFEGYAKNLTCYKYTKLPNSFLVAPTRFNNVINRRRQKMRFEKEAKDVKPTSLKWDWIRRKRSLLSIGESLEDVTISDEKDYDNDDDNEVEGGFSILKYQPPKNDRYLDKENEFERLYKGEDNVYRKRKKKRRKRTAGDMRQLKLGLKYLPPIKSTDNLVYVMAGDDIQLNCPHFYKGNPMVTMCHASQEYDPREEVYWQADRYDMLRYENVVFNPSILSIEKVSGKNAGNYSCYRSGRLYRSLKLIPVVLPKFHVVFIPMYELKDNCSQQYLRDVQALGAVMSKSEGTCGINTVKISEPTCLEDKDDMSEYIRTTAILTACPSINIDNKKCSTECRRDIHCGLALMCASNAPVLSSVKVVVMKGYGNYTLTPTPKNTRKLIVTHSLGRKDIMGLEFHQLTTAMYPGDLDVVVSCPAGYFLMPAIKMCAACPADTYSNLGENTCYQCPPGTTSAPGARRCRLSLKHLRKYEPLQWWWYPPCGYAMAILCTMCCFVLCAVCGLVAHVTSRPTSVRRQDPVAVNRVDSRWNWSRRNGRHAMKQCSSTSAGGARGKQLSPSAVILARFFKGSGSSSRVSGRRSTAGYSEEALPTLREDGQLQESTTKAQLGQQTFVRDSQEKKFERWKKRNIPPPLPPIDFDLTDS